MGLLCVVPQRPIRVLAPARPHVGRASKRGKINVTPLEKRAVSGSDEGGSDASRGSDKAKNHFPSLPAIANQEAGFVPTHRYGRGSDFESDWSAERLPPEAPTLNPKPLTLNP